MLGLELVKDVLELSLEEIELREPVLAESS
jgi:hypothetical protein